MKKITFFNNNAEVFVIEKQEFINLEIYPYSILSRLPSEEQDKFHTYINLGAKTTYITARYYLRKLLAESLQIEDLSSIRIAISESGKPYLQDYSDIYFNISHTKDLILIGFSKFPIGVDVETIQRDVSKDSIIKHFFSKNEQESYLSQPIEEREKAFFVGWTRKEALLKATGDGLSKMNQNEISFDINTDSPIINCQNPEAIRIENFYPSQNHLGCVVIIKN